MTPISTKALSVVVLLEHDVRDGRPLATGRPHIVSEKLQFAAIGPDGNAADAGIAPHLNLRPARPDEVALVDDLLAEAWLNSDLERTATAFATVDLATDACRGGEGAPFAGDRESRT